MRAAEDEGEEANNRRCSLVNGVLNGVRTAEATPLRSRDTHRGEQASARVSAFPSTDVNNESLLVWSGRDRAESAEWETRAIKSSFGNVLRQ